MAEHDRVGRGDQREHEILQRDRKGQAEQFPIENPVAE